MPGIMCPAFIFLPDKNNTTSIETPCCFIQRKTPVRICPLPKAALRSGVSPCFFSYSCVSTRRANSEPPFLSVFPWHAGKRFCARRAIGHRHQPDGFSRGKKLVACFLKLVARILKSEPLIFSFLPCGVNALKTSFHFSAPKMPVFRHKFSTAGGGNSHTRKRKCKA